MSCTYTQYVPGMILFSIKAQLCTLTSIYEYRTPKKNNGNSSVYTIVVLLWPGNELYYACSLFHAGKKYGVLDAIALMCMTLEIILFTLADSTLYNLSLTVQVYVPVPWRLYSVH